MKLGGRKRKKEDIVASSTALKDAVAFVTGAGSGIGRAIALALAARGAKVIMVGRDIDKLKAVAAEAGENAHMRCRQLDLAIDAQVLELAERLKRELGGLDVLVHCAGIFRMGLMAESDVECLDEQYRVNLRAPYVLTRSLLPMLKKSRGQIVFMNSGAALHAHTNWGAYSATKSGLKLLADSLRMEVNPHGVRVLSVFPGRTASPMQEQIHRAEKRKYRHERLLQPEDIAATVMQTLELPRTAEVTEIAIRPHMKLA